VLWLGISVHIISWADSALVGIYPWAGLGSFELGAMRMVDIEIWLVKDLAVFVGIYYIPSRKHNSHHYTTSFMLSILGYSGN
jgi:hypothetical protein